MNQTDTEQAITTLNRILEMELAGVVRYTHYSFMVFGFGRIPIVSWLRTQADESLLHAREAGEMITLLGGYPSLGLGPLLDSHQSDIGAILVESLQAETATLAVYRELLRHVEGKSVLLEEYARRMIATEEVHAGEVDKMLRKPGDVAPYRAR
jgi:bacterioferritin